MNDYQEKSLILFEDFFLVKLFKKNTHTQPFLSTLRCFLYDSLFTLSNSINFSSKQTNLRPQLCMQWGGNVSYSICCSSGLGWTPVEQILIKSNPTVWGKFATLQRDEKEAMGQWIKTNN